VYWVPKSGNKGFLLQTHLSGVVYDDRRMSGAMHQQVHHWQAQRPNTEAFHASRSHLNSPHPEQYSTEQVAPNRSSYTTAYSITISTSLHLFFAFAHFFSFSLSILPVPARFMTFIQLLHANETQFPEDFFSMPYIRHFQGTEQTILLSLPSLLRVYLIPAMMARYTLPGMVRARRSQVM
jgi:hypothetical protein